MNKINVLFVCLGNICRSPMAEAVFRHLVQKEGLDAFVQTDSAGTAGWHSGNPPHEGTRNILDSKQITYKGMKARQINKQDQYDFQYIVCMDSQNYRDVVEVFGCNIEGRGKVITFMELSPTDGVTDVPDPYYTGNFEYVYELIEKGCYALIDEIKQRLAEQQ